MSLEEACQSHFEPRLSVRLLDQGHLHLFAGLRDASTSVAVRVGASRTHQRPDRIAILQRPCERLQHKHGKPLASPIAIPSMVEAEAFRVWGKESHVAERDVHLG